MSTKIQSTDAKAIFGQMADRESSIKPVPSKQETIEVYLDLDGIFEEYQKSMMYVLDSEDSSNPRNSKVGLTGDDIHYYCGYALQQRIARCNGEKVNFNLLNELVVPAFFKTALEMIGVYSDTVHGYTFVPKTKDTTSYDEDRIREISVKFSRLDGIIQTVKGAAPRHIEGDPEVMTMACIEDHVTSMHEATHPLMTYFAAFLNAKVAEEIAMRGLYCLQYDNLSYLAFIFRQQGSCLC